MGSNKKFLIYCEQEDRMGIESQKMAASGVDVQDTSRRNIIGLQNPGASFQTVSSGDSQFNDVILENQIESYFDFAYCLQNTVIVQAVTGSCANVSDTRSKVDSIESVYPNDFYFLDSTLLNLPKDFYVQKLLEITSNNEQLIIEYRYALHAREKIFRGVEWVNSLLEKRTSAVPARPNMLKIVFCNEDSSHFGDVIDKSKQEHLNELPSQLNIEIRSLYQALLQRVTQFEQTQSSFSKTIQSLKKTDN